MTLRCPQCGTEYDLDQRAFTGPGRLACCHHCGSFFGLATGRVASIATLRAEAMADAVRLTDAHRRGAPPTTGDAEIEIPEDLAPLPTVDATLSSAAPLPEQQRSQMLVNGGYVLVALVLAAVFALQLAWLYHTELLQRFPGLTTLCEHLPCQPAPISAAEAFEVLQRDLGPSRRHPGALALNLSFRSTVRTSRPLPKVQLSLLDNRGEVLVRRRLSPDEYLSSPSTSATAAAPGEVTAFEVDFVDPGYRATGFAIDFL
jgi:hypothetical protein